jgi:hypothetical protein
MIVTGCEGGRLAPPPQPMRRHSKNAQFRTPINFFRLITLGEDIEISIRGLLERTATHAIKFGFISPPLAYVRRKVLECAATLAHACASVNVPAMIRE